jgi:hypothetical protein
MILGDKPLISEVVLSHDHLSSGTNCWHSPELEASPNCSELTHERKEEDE